MKKINKLSFLVILLVMLALSLSACSGVEVTINFDSNDGSEVAPVSTTGDATLSIPQNPTKEGFIFDGWYWDNETFNRQFTANSLLDAPIQSNMTVYAKWKVTQQVDDYLISATGFEIEGDNLYLEVSNTTENFSFINKFDFTSGISFLVSRDINGSDIITSKTIALNAGDNEVYILAVSNNDTLSMYNVVIRRRPIYNITFDADINSQTIEERDFVIEPTTPNKTGYTFDK